MKAITFSQHGGPEVLNYTDLPTPKPVHGEALVKLEAAALNRMDILVRAGWKVTSAPTRRSGKTEVHFPGLPGHGFFRWKTQCLRVKRSVW